MDLIIGSCQQLSFTLQHKSVGFTQPTIGGTLQEKLQISIHCFFLCREYGVSHELIPHTKIHNILYLDGGHMPCLPVYIKYSSAFSLAYRFELALCVDDSWDPTLTKDSPGDSSVPSPPPHVARFPLHVVFIHSRLHLDAMFQNNKDPLNILIPNTQGSKHKGAW